MPIYTIEDTKTGKTYDVNVKWTELQKLLVQEPHLKKVVTAPMIVGGVGDESDAYSSHHQTDYGHGRRKGHR